MSIPPNPNGLLPVKDGNAARVVVGYSGERKSDEVESGMPNCPGCGSSYVIRNGHIHNGKAKFACKACRRQFVENPQQQPISEGTKALVDKLLLERLSLAGIVRTTGVSARWLQHYINAKYEGVPQVAEVPAPKKGD